MRIVLLGSPGAGKGTQARWLADSLGVPHIASGELFREHQQRGTELGLMARAYMESGSLVPDEVTTPMVLDRIGAPDCSKGFVLEGFPRTLAQARALDGVLSNHKESIGQVIYLRVSEKELMRRLSGRLICRLCQTPYHVSSSPPKENMRCDRCGGELYHRTDDTPEAARKRIQVYQEETASLIRYYMEQGVLREIDGEGPEGKVREALASLVTTA